MKMWQAFVVGLVVLIAALLLPLYEFVLAGIGAVVVVSAVVFGFALRPRREVFYLRTTVYIADIDYQLSLEHDCLAVRVELARLWLLFAPTFLGVGFLVATAARGTTWHFSLMSLFAEEGYLFVASRGLLVVTIGVLSVWLSERWVLRDAAACSARYVSVENGRISYMFVDRSGEYYGGEGFPFRSVRPQVLATLVLYNVGKPELNKIGMGCLFHRLVILGRGVTDLDEVTVAAHPVPVRISSP